MGWDPATDSIRHSTAKDRRVKGARDFLAHQAAASAARALEAGLEAPAAVSVEGAEAAASALVVDSRADVPGSDGCATTACAGRCTRASAALSSMPRRSH